MFEFNGKELPWDDSFCFHCGKELPEFVEGEPEHVFNGFCSHACEAAQEVEDGGKWAELML